MGTWQDAQGDSLVLSEDGTFRSSSVCGNYRDSVTGTGSLFGAASVKTGTGIWEKSESESSGKNLTEVRREYGKGEVSAQYEVRGTAAAPVLWIRWRAPRAALRTERQGRWPIAHAAGWEPALSHTQDARAVTVADPSRPGEKVGRALHRNVRRPQRPADSSAAAALLPAGSRMSTFHTSGNASKWWFGSRPGTG